MKKKNTVLAIVVGAIAGMVLIGLGEALIELVFPFPAGTNLRNKAELANAIRQMPQNAFICLLINYIIASFAGGIIATLISKRVTLQPAAIVGVILTLVGSYNTLTMSQPLWFSIANISCYLPLAYLGGRTVIRK